MPTALFVSPHLDDVVFSCGGLAAILSGRGWHTVLLTTFTRSVVPASGFALACQLDKGLPPDADYMAIRREEDREAAGLLGFSDVRWLDMLEAPHRGYGSAAELFGALHPDDSVTLPLAAHLMAAVAELKPDVVLAPQGLGNHVDHQHVTAAAQLAAEPCRAAFYRDTPYAIRSPNAAALPSVPSAEQAVVPIGAVLDRKIAAAQAYRSQIGFQFNGPEPLARALRNFAEQEGGGIPAERFTGGAAPVLAAEAA